MKLHPGCLTFFSDETGHEQFADPNYPVFGIGGCAVPAGGLSEVVKKPWRAMKEKYFGGADIPLHASALREPSDDQLNALNHFFTQNHFGRFAETMTANVILPKDRTPYEIMTLAVRQCWQELTSRCDPIPTELAFVHEASHRGDKLIERYFGETKAEIHGHKIRVHQVLLAKHLRDEALEVADFIVQAAGRQALNWMRGDNKVRRDFRVIFGTNKLWSIYIDLDGLTVIDADQSSSRQ